MADTLAEPLQGTLPRPNRIAGAYIGMLNQLPDNRVAQKNPVTPTLANLVEAQYSSPTLSIAKSKEELRTKYEEALLKVLPADRETTLTDLIQKVEIDLDGLEQNQAFAKVQNARSALVDLSLRLVDQRYISTTTPSTLEQVRTTVDYLSLKLLDNSPSTMVNFHETTLQLLESIVQRVSDPDTRRLIQDKLLRYLSSSPPDLLRNYARNIYNAISRG